MSGEPGRIRVVAAVVTRGACVLLTQRPPGGPLGLLWEFPGGKIEPGETPADALVRELREELGVEARARGVLTEHTHFYDHGLHVDLTFVRATLATDAFTPSAAVHAVRWVDPRAVRPEELLEADRPFLRTLRERADAGTLDAHEEDRGGTA